jgi:hypothetical protein
MQTMSTYGTHRYEWQPSLLYLKYTHRRKELRRFWNAFAPVIDTQTFTHCKVKQARWIWFHAVLWRQFYSWTLLVELLQFQYLDYLIWQLFMTRNALRARGDGNDWGTHNNEGAESLNILSHTANWRGKSITNKLRLVMKSEMVFAGVFEAIPGRLLPSTIRRLKLVNRYDD